MKRIVANLKQSFICRYCVISLLRFGKSDIHCVQKKHPLTFSFISPWIICGFLDFNKNCGKYTQGLIDSDNVKIIYSLRSMTYLWRHICLAKAGASLQHATPRISFFCEYWVLAGAQTRSYSVLCGGIKDNNFTIKQVKVYMLPFCGEIKMNIYTNFNS